MSTDLDRSFPMRTISKSEYPETLQNAKGIPGSLYMRGSLPPAHYKYLCVVGSRHNSAYGQEVVEKLIAGLAGYPICIVSGLAIGIDSLAHKAALLAKLPTIAFPGSGLNWNVIYPSCHKNLAEQILNKGGALLSKWEPSFNNTDRWVFPTRNGLMAAFSDALLIIEARRKSGTWTTIEAAIRFDRDMMVVPGSIFSELSVTPLALMDDGAKRVTCSEDILEVLELISPRPKLNHNDNEDGQSDSVNQPVNNLFDIFNDPSLSGESRKIIDRVRAPVSRDDLIRELALPPGYVNALLIELEMKGLIAERDGCLTVR